MTLTQFTSSAQYQMLHLTLDAAPDAFLSVQLKDETERCEEDEAEKRVKLKAMREHHHKWEDTREGRVGTWRDFVKGKKTRVCLSAA